MKEDLDLLIEEKWRKQYEFVPFISAIEKLPSSKEIKLALCQGNNFINVYNIFYDKHHGHWIKDILLL